MLHGLKKDATPSEALIGVAEALEESAKSCDATNVELAEEMRKNTEAAAKKRKQAEEYLAAAARLQEVST